MIKNFEEYLLEKSLSLLGKSVKVDFPEFGLSGVEVKVDTGAHTSSIHCSYIEKLKDDTVKFIPINGKEMILPIDHERDVKSSNGEVENRPMIKTRILIMDELHDIHLTLTDRSDMTYPVLLGSKFLSGKFVVDVSL